MTTSSGSVSCVSPVSRAGPSWVWSKRQRAAAEGGQRDEGRTRRALLGRAKEHLGAVDAEDVRALEVARRGRQAGRQVGRPSGTHARVRPSASTFHRARRRARSGRTVVTTARPSSDSTLRHLAARTSVRTSSGSAGGQGVDVARGWVGWEVWRAAAREPHLRLLHRSSFRSADMVRLGLVKEGLGRGSSRTRRAEGWSCRASSWSTSWVELMSEL